MQLCIGWLLLFLVSVRAGAQSVPLPEATPWQHDRAAAISLTFDDGLPSQLDHAGPILRKHHLTGTFFVITGGDAWRNRPEDWRKLAAEGNEIASHTVNHPCLLKEIKPNSLPYTPEMMRAELRDSAQAIISRLGITRGLTFNYPCGEMTFGPPEEQSRNQAHYLDDVAEFYFAARADSAGSPVDPEEMNPLTVNTLGGGTGEDFPGLLAKMRPALDHQLWGVLVFHGVGGDYLSISAEPFDQLASYLEQHREIWCAPFGDVFRYIQERKTLEVHPTESAPRRVQFALRWPMDPKIYDVPLTLKWMLPAGWTACQAEADGRPLACPTSGEPDQRMVLVDVPPQTNTIAFEAK